METTTFAELGLSSRVLAAIEAAGYTTPTPIQTRAIPIAVSGRDVLGIAQTGTGKTAAFVMPMITRLETGRARARMPRSLILAPTRELAAQVAQSFERYGVNHKLNVALLIGGVSFDDQEKKLDRGADVLIATPGRMLDHFQRGKLMLMGVEILVIDEADRMLDMGFIPDIEKICKLLPPRRQTLFFSATMPPEITRLVDQFLKDPVRIEVARPATTAKTITQRFRFCRSTEDWEKREVLRELLRGETVRNAIIFSNRKRDVAILHKSLVKHGFNAGALHGDMDQKSRMETLDRFRSGEITFLAASDVAARGLDIPDVSHVFNYDIPWAGDDYVHRIGRTGRAGREGSAISIVTPEDLRLIKDIEKVTGETPTWIGDAPVAEDFADGGKRRRGRGGRERSGRDRGETRGEGGNGARRGRESRGGGGRGQSRRQEERQATAAPAPEMAFGATEATQPAPQERGRWAEPQNRDSRRPPRRERAPMAADTPQPVVENTAQSSGGADREASNAPHREPRGSRQASGRATRADRPERADQGQRQRAQKAESHERGGDKPIGFADNVPAFMRKPVRTGT